MTDQPHYSREREVLYITAVCHWLVALQRVTQTGDRTSDSVATQGEAEGLLEISTVDGKQMIGLTDKGRELGVRLIKQANAKNN